MEKNKTLWIENDSEKRFHLTRIYKNIANADREKK
jgi:hypothetical protein